MRGCSMTAAAALLLASCLLPAAAGAQAESCEAGWLAEKLHERMSAEGRSDGAIREILDSGFKRGILRERVAGSSGCSADQVEAALRELAARVAG